MSYLWEYWVFLLVGQVCSCIPQVKFFNSVTIIFIPRILVWFFFITSVSFWYSYFAHIPFFKFYLVVYPCFLLSLNILMMFFWILCLIPVCSFVYIPVSFPGDLIFFFERCFSCYQSLLSVFVVGFIQGRLSSVFLPRDSGNFSSLVWRYTLPELFLVI